MPDNHLYFHSSSGKRRVMIVEDEPINQEILSMILEDSYELLKAQTGQEAIEILQAHFDTLSAVLLDLVLPDIHGLDILRLMKSDSRYGKIPVIVMTSDKESEVDSLNFGASDFIPKPYPLPKVILARVRRTIELSEDRDIIRFTERDQLTGLYNREYFYHYADQYDMYHKDQDMDAIVINVSHFHLFNERYGRSYGDEILKSLAEKLKQTVPEGGLLCRRDADTFLIYCRHLDSYEDFLHIGTESFGTDGKARIRLRVGVYASADKKLDLERRFDRAKMASDSLRSGFSTAAARYDSSMHEKEIFSEQLLESFDAALQQKQFQVFYQPKFDIRPKEPILTSAEALVRWSLPTIGPVSPAVFIPLFEKNGMIQKLDQYVWEETAKQIREWKTRLGFSVPVSVNVSRIDILAPETLPFLNNLIQKYGLAYSDLHLEITESAYTQDATQIVCVVTALRELGFVIEMDDFGTGYSSLNMISTLPIDALKLDMEFIRTAFSEQKDTRMLEVVFDIADSLFVPTIAEGVETAEQMLALKSMGCDYVQGYYFSPPVPASQFEHFLLERKHLKDAAFMPEKKIGRISAGRAAHDKYTYDVLHDPVTGVYNRCGFDVLFRDVDMDHICLILGKIENYDALSPEMSDQAARRVSLVLRQSFRSVDIVCRVEDDTFAVIVTRITRVLEQLICTKLEHIIQLLSRTDGDVPGCTLSFGAAFSDRLNPQGDICHDAQLALSSARQQRTKGYLVFHVHDKT